MNATLNIVWTSEDNEYRVIRHENGKHQPQHSITGEHGLDWYDFLKSYKTERGAVNAIKALLNDVAESTVAAPEQKDAATTTTAVQIADSRKRVRTLTIKGMIKPSGLRVARVTNERGETYRVQVRPDGTGTCQCESRRPCYHMKAVLAAVLPTFEELTAYTIAEAMADANEAISAFVRQPVRCGGCGGTCGQGKASDCTSSRCRWNSWYRPVA